MISIRNDFASSSPSSAFVVTAASSYEQWRHSAEFEPELTLTTQCDNRHLPLS